ncbi:MAG: histone deacetylase family protein [Candidatus Thermoplasmatota archaeon]
MPVRAGDPIAIYYHESMARYDLGEGHPFRANRFTQFMELLEGMEPSLPGVEVRLPNKAMDGDLLLAHTPEYVRVVKELARHCGHLSVDTPLTTDMVDAAMMIVGAALDGAEWIAGMECSTAVTFGGFHHAGRTYGEGFCVFNDVAIAAQALLDRYGMNRVLILDTDAHQGNGTMDIFWEEPRVLFISIHQDPKTLYPGRGFAWEIGEGEGKGYTVNIPMPAYSGNRQYEYALRELYLPLCKEFNPDAIIRNGGADPHHSDELTNLSLDLRGLEMVGRIVREGVDMTSGKLLDLMVSGYGPMTPYGWLALFSGVTGISMDYASGAGEEKLHRSQTTETMLDELARAAVMQVKAYLKDYWGCLRG